MKRFLTTLALSLLLALPLLSPISRVQAAESWRFSSVGQEFDAADDTGSVSQAPYLDRSGIVMLSFYICRIRPALGICTEKPEKLGALYNQSAIGFINNSIVAMYQNQPAYFALWLRDASQTLGFLPGQAHAQGVGFSGLSMLLPVWKIFRNIAYLLVAIATIIVGFMVMLRKKIDPKTVVTVQNALPRIVVTLILITFSYAIAGLLIDVMYIVFSLLISLLVQGFPKFLGPDTLNKYLSGGLPTTTAALFWGGWSSIDDLVKLIFYGEEGGLKWWLSSIADLIVVKLPAEYILVWFIVSIALLFGYIRIIFLLLSAYIQLIISVIIAPLQMLIDVFPGGTGFSSWIKNYVANLSVFPITAAMLLIGTVLTKDYDNLWVPPLLGTAGETSRGLVGLIGLGVLLTIPSVANSIKEALKTKGVPVGPGAVLGPLGMGAGQLMQLGYQASFVYSAFKHKPQTTTREEQLAAAGKGEVAGGHKK